MKHAPANSSIISAIKSSMAQNSLSAGQSLHAFTMKIGLYTQPTLYIHLLNLLAKPHRLEDARDLFDEMPERNLIFYSTLISSNSQSGDPKLALNLMTHLPKLGIATNPFVFSSSIAACSKLNSVALGEQIHAQVIVSCFEPEPFVCTALIDVYSKVENTMTTGYAKHWNGLEAIELYKMMERHNIDPNHVTFVSLLSACSHCGRVEDGIQLLELMVSEHGIEPLMEHYTCGEKTQKIFCQFFLSLD